MKNKWAIFLSLPVFLLHSFQKEKIIPEKDFVIRQLAPGVWAVIHHEQGGRAICNAGIVDLGNKTLVFDAFINQNAAAELKKKAEQLTGRPVSFVINSHFHDDHIRGNQSFIPGASIISTEWTKNKIQETEPGEQEWAKKNTATQLKKSMEQLASAPENEKNEASVWVNYYKAITQSLPDLKMTLPDITFSNSFRIYGSKRTVQLVEYKNCHTGSDIVMILPEEGIVFMGDLLFTERHPWLGDGNPETWKSTLNKLYADTTLKLFVPGHGRVCQKDQLQVLMHYIESLQQMSLSAIQKNVPDSVFIRSQMPEAYKDWSFKRFFMPNLSSVYENTRKINQ
ncbi:MAG: MBL fold metallo-hydrolase [Chitinophagaceae bacterium]|nr:MBL fold metallo-hydrolase [Chitinophagaceae bacterium]